MRVDKENFSPAPKVDSAILLINNISKKFFVENKITEKNFFELIHAGFAHKRKMLLGNLRSVFKGKRDLDQIFIISKLSLKTRAEELKLSDWAKLVQKI